MLLSRATCRFIARFNQQWERDGREAIQFAVLTHYEKLLKYVAKLPCGLLYVVHPLCALKRLHLGPESLNEQMGVSLLSHQAMWSTAYRGHWNYKTKWHSATMCEPWSVTVRRGQTVSDYFQRIGKTNCIVSSPSFIVTVWSPTLAGMQLCKQIHFLLICFFDSSVSFSTSVGFIVEPKNSCLIARKLWSQVDCVRLAWCLRGMI